jgi:hypothetical protein
VIPMNRSVTFLLAALTMSSAPLPVVAQSRGSGGSPTRGPSAGRHPGPARPSSPSTAPARVSPTPVPGHRFPSRSLRFGLLLFDPCWLWAPSEVDETCLPPAALPPGDERPTGGLQLDVEPRRALVYVDGWFVGLVDAFSGYYHHLDLPAGSHRVEFVASEYDPLMVNVTVSPDATATFRGSLNRR